MCCVILLQLSCKFSSLRYIILVLFILICQQHSLCFRQQQRVASERDTVCLPGVGLQVLHVRLHQAQSEKLRIRI